MKYFLTGITGTLGRAVSNLLLKHDENEIVGFSRDECKQAKLNLHPRLTLYLGDVRDRDRVIEASRNCDVILHFAALKHVDKLEANPEEAISTNIVGTMNLLHAQRIHKIPKLLLTSTDKSVYPVNTYGMTKGIAERLVLRNPHNVVCRYGNVLASRGSCVESFVSTLKELGSVYLTDPNMTRFWVTQNDAAQFVISKIPANVTGLQIPTMKAAPVHLIAQAVADVMNIPSYQTIQVGVRAGEKTHECLKTEYEGGEFYSHHAEQFSISQLQTMLGPIVKDLG